MDFASYMFSPNAQEIYERLADDESRFIFEKRLQFCITEDEYSLREMVAGVVGFAFQRKYSGKQEIVYDGFPHSFVSLIEDYKSRKFEKLVLYPHGAYARFLSGLLYSYGIPTALFGDKNHHRFEAGGIFGTPVISLEEIAQNCKEYAILITSQTVYDSIINDFNELGLLDHSLHIYTNAVLYEKQYFGPDFMNPMPGEIYVDIGAYDGDTIKDFCNTNPNYQRIMAFEPNYELANGIRNLALPRTEVYAHGVGESGEKTDFYKLPNGQLMKATIKLGYPVISLQEKTLDSIVGDGNVTLIKADIEGSELVMLKGASETIRCNRPRLAIAVYHNPYDIVQLPTYILSLVPDYKLYLRHHTVNHNETILYAI